MILDTGFVIAFLGTLIFTAYLITAFLQIRYKTISTLEKTVNELRDLRSAIYKIEDKFYRMEQTINSIEFFTKKK